jgi:hypothetical protein
LRLFKRRNRIEWNALGSITIYLYCRMDGESCNGCIQKRSMLARRRCRQEMETTPGEGEGEETGAKTVARPSSNPTRESAWARSAWDGICYEYNFRPRSTYRPAIKTWRTPCYLFHTNFHRYSFNAQVPMIDVRTHGSNIPICPFLSHTWTTPYLTSSIFRNR